MSHMLDDEAHPEETHLDLRNTVMLSIVFVLLLQIGLLTYGGNPTPEPGPGHATARLAR